MKNKVFYFYLILLSGLLLACKSDEVKNEVSAIFVGTIEEINV